MSTLISAQNENTEILNDKKDKFAHFTHMPPRLPHTLLKEGTAWKLPSTHHTFAATHFLLIFLFLLPGTLPHPATTHHTCPATPHTTPATHTTTPPFPATHHYLPCHHLALALPPSTMPPHHTLCHTSSARPTHTQHTRLGSSAILWHAAIQACLAHMARWPPSSLSVSHLLPARLWVGLNCLGYKSSGLLLMDSCAQSGAFMPPHSLHGRFAAFRIYPHSPHAHQGLFIFSTRTAAATRAYHLKKWHSRTACGGGQFLTSQAIIQTRRRFWGRQLNYLKLCSNHGSRSTINTAHHAAGTIGLLFSPPQLRGGLC